MAKKSMHTVKKAGLVLRARLVGDAPLKITESDQFYEFQIPRSNGSFDNLKYIVTISAPEDIRDEITKTECANFRRDYRRFLDRIMDAHSIAGPGSYPEYIDLEFKIH